MSFWIPTWEYFFGEGSRWLSYLFSRIAPDQP